MNWYISKLVFRITADDTEHRPQFDEQLRLITAKSDGEAFLKARTIGISEEDAFPNEQNNIVRWEFINVSEVIPLGKIDRKSVV